MCRSGAKGGRRCPSHTDEQLIKARNERRREQYADEKLQKTTIALLDEHGIKYSFGDMPTMYFQGNEEFDINKFEEVKDAQPVPQIEGFEGYTSMQSKPAGGGLWVAPGTKAEDGTVKTLWTDWVHAEDFRRVDTPIHPFDCKPHALIIKMETREDLEALKKAFPGGVHFSYEKMAAAGVDAFHLTEKALRTAKGAKSGDPMATFSHWDMESAVWLRTRNLKIGKPVEKGHYEPNTDRYDDDYDPDWDMFKDPAYKPDFDMETFLNSGAK